MTNDVNVGAVAPVKKKRKKIASLDKRKARAGWIFVLPFIIGFVLIYLPMIVQSIQISFSEILVGSTGGSFEFYPVGFKNYSDALLADPEFVKILIQGLTTLAFDIPAILIFSLFMAIMLNQKMAGRAVFRSIFFIPVILSTGIMESINAMDSMSGYMEGGIDDGSGEVGASDQLISSLDLQMLFANMKVGTELVDYIVEIINNIYGIVNRSGVQMLIFLSALQSISPAIYESCKIDGATGWETFWKITFPMISPMILVNGVYTVIDSFTTESNPVMVFVAKKYGEGFDELSTAMSWIYFLIVILLVAVVAAIFSAFVFYQRKND